MIHFDFDDRYQDEAVVGSAVSGGSRVLLSGAFHVGIILLLLFGGRLLNLFGPSPEELERRRQQMVQQQLEQERNQRRFVFVQPRVERPAPKPPPRPELSDLDRKAAAPELSKKPDNPLPFSRGNSAERVEASRAERGEENPPTPDPPKPEPPKQDAARLPEADNGLRRPLELPKGATAPLRNGLKNLQQYVQNQTFNNPSGGSKDPGQAIQFDTKGVEFGPWVRRFVIKVRRNWDVPQAAFTFHGRVVLQFNVHRDGHITDLVVVQPSDIDAFNRAAFNAILGSNPVEPLPPEYPDDKAFFTVTFYYNESPVN